MAEPTPPVPLELLELARVHIKPGETLFVSPKQGHPMLDVYTCQELYDFLREQLPDIPLVVLPLPVDLTAASKDQAADLER